jgi:hypothetical protein
VRANDFTATPAGRVADAVPARGFAIARLAAGAFAVVFFELRAVFVAVAIAGPPVWDAV